MNKYLALVALILVGATFQNCGQKPGSPSSQMDSNYTNPQDIQFKQDNLRANIEEMVEQSRCETATDCRSIAFGNKLCGGPTSYLLYSAKDTDEDELANMVSEYNEMEREDQLNTDEALTGDCGFIAEPEHIACVQNSCTNYISQN